MPINTTALGLIIFTIMAVTIILLLPLAKRKTQTPIIAIIIGVLLSFIPPLGLIYLAAIVLKNDIPK